MAVFSDVICAHDGKFYTWKDFVNHCGIFFGQFAFCCHGIRDLLSTIMSTHMKADFLRTHGDPDISYQVV